MILFSPLTRLHDTIAAVCPILGLAGSQGSVTIQFDPAATQQQKDAAATALAAFDWSDAAQTVRDNLTARTAAKAQVNSGILAQDKLSRALASVLLDEINALRDWITAFKAAMAAATSLANLQTRVAALAAMPDRTLAQAKTAIGNAIDAGTVD